MVEVGSQESPIIGANLKNSIKYVTHDHYLNICYTHILFTLRYQRDLSAFSKCSKRTESRSPDAIFKHTSFGLPFNLSLFRRRVGFCPRYKAMCGLSPEADLLLARLITPIKIHM